jgi:tetratricopeptide (TPR) repeat protein
MIHRTLLIVSIMLTSFLCFSQEQKWRIEYDSCKFHFNKGDYSNASLCLENILPDVEKNIEDTSVYYEIKNVLAISYLKTGKATQAEPLFQQTIKYYRTDTTLSKHSNYSTALIQLAVLYYSSKKFQDAESLFISALEVQRRTRGEKQADYIILLNNLATIETLLKKFNTADSIYQKLLTLKREVYGERHPEYVASLNTLATMYKNSGRINDAEKIYIQLSSILKDSLGENHPDYGTSLNNLAHLYQNSGRYSEAEPFYIKIIQIKKQNPGEKTADYAASLNNLAILYKIMSKYAEAEPLLLQSASIYKEIGGEKNIPYATSLSSLAGLYRNMGHYSKSENLYKEAEIIFRELVGENHSDYASLLNNMALLHDEMGHYELAESLYKRVLEITKSTLGVKNTEYATSLNNIALLYKSMGRYEQAEPLYKQALQIRKEILGEKNIYYGESLNNLASLYQSMGRDKEAETLYQQALQIFKNTFGEKHPEYASSLNNLAGLYEHSGQFAKSEALYNQSLQIIKETLGEHHPSYATAVNNLALLYEKTGKFFESEKLYKLDLEIVKATLGVTHPSYASSLSNLAGLYENMGRYKEAEGFYLQAIQIRKNTLGEKHPDYAVVINNLARVYTATSRLDEAEKLWKEAIANYLYQINTYFPSMSEKEKEQFYNTISHKFEQFNSFALLRAKKDPSILSMMYNNQLATKALLLNASNKLRERILNSGDANLITAYKKWQSEKELLAQVYSLTKEERANKKINIDSLESKTNELEKELSLKSELFKSTNERQDYKWEDIQKKLKSGEAAVEIIRFFKYKADSAGIYTDSVYYAALIVKQNTKGNPELVLMKNGRDLEERYIKFYRNSIKFKVQDEHAYLQYWKKIKDALEVATKVYLSPDGVYNQINLYSIRNQETKNYILDEIAIEIVTNTKDLLQPASAKSPQNKIVLLGNPAFYFSETTGTTVALPPLPATTTEVQKINTMMLESNWAGQVFTGQVASEEKIKEVKDARVLHIATHGFFEADVHNTEEKGSDKKSENPLFRSGLMLAGAGLTSRDNNSGEDGILTAYEAMNLNLDNTDLVVLSACETGLGEIKNGEGVYGLQRAFRVAGAKSIIISLWKVNDETTQKLMIYFYEEWLKSGDKRKAFTLAQAKIRKEFSEPYYWGAFVMIGE